MAFSPLRLKTAHHVRSLSLPYKSHPSMSQFDETLSTLKASEVRSSSVSSFNIRINGLTNLYQNFQSSILLPHVQRAVSQQSQDKWVDQLLEGHINLLDACSATKDLFSEMKRNVEELHSALRRKDMQSVNFYMTSRKRLRKTIQKSLKDLKSSRNTTQSFEKDNEIVYMLKEAESATFFVLEFLLSYAMGSKMKSRWSLVSKLMQSNKVSNQSGETDLNEFMKVDALLHMSKEDTQIQLMDHLKEMESNIRVLEEELECFFRQLIKTRVLLLNIVN